MRAYFVWLATCVCASLFSDLIYFFDEKFFGIGWNLHQVLKRILHACSFTRCWRPRFLVSVSNTGWKTSTWIPYQPVLIAYFLVVPCSCVIHIRVFQGLSNLTAAKLMWRNWNVSPLHSPPWYIYVYPFLCWALNSGHLLPTASY